MPSFLFLFVARSHSADACRRGRRGLSREHAGARPVTQRSGADIQCAAGRARDNGGARAGACGAHAG